MKKIMAILMGIWFFFGVSAAWADPKDMGMQVILHETPDAHSKVIAIYDPDIRLVQVFQQKEWIKVGNPANGQVGWVNMQQFRQARQAFYRPDIQTVFVHVDHSPSGKASLNVVAYKNGQQMTDQQAKALYNRLRKQQEEEYRQMQNLSAQIDGMMNQQLSTMHQFFDNAWRDTASLQSQLSTASRPLPNL